MSNFIFNSHLVSTPPGIIEPYIGGGTTTSGTNPGDPDGWVICDGQLRTVSDGRFVNLAAILNTYMGVSTNTSNSITPPDLRGRFLRGCNSAATNVIASGGTSNITLDTNTLPPHNHSVTINDPGHYHANRIYAADNKDFTSLANQLPPVDSANATNNYWQTMSSFTGITSASASCGNAGTATPSSFSVIPSYTTINYVMRY